MLRLNCIWIWEWDGAIELRRRRGETHLGDIDLGDRQMGGDSAMVAHGVTRIEITMLWF